MPHINYDIEKPTRAMDHWTIFREIYNTIQSDDPWTSELLFFTADWFNHLEEPEWQSFSNYLYRTAWKSSEFWRNHNIMPLSLTRFQSQKKLKPVSYIDDLVSHTVSVAVGCNDPAKTAHLGC